MDAPKPLVVAVFPISNVAGRLLHYMRCLPACLPDAQSVVEASRAGHDELIPKLDSARHFVQQDKETSILTSQVPAPTSQPYHLIVAFICLDISCTSHSSPLSSKLHVKRTKRMTHRPPSSEATTSLLPSLF